MRTLYDTVLMASRTIRNSPELFNFMSTDKPDPCGTPGCAIGWINYYANLPADDSGLYRSNFSYVMEIFYNNPASESLFYEEMDLVCRSDFWMEDADECAETLLKWAEKHEEKLKSIELPL